ncbi:hypothetical protein LINPERHAP1_LOCUS10941 [Linum perenne]
MITNEGSSSLYRLPLASRIIYRSYGLDYPNLVAKIGVLEYSYSRTLYLNIYMVMMKVPLPSRIFSYVLRPSMCFSSLLEFSGPLANLMLEHWP